MNGEKFSLENIEWQFFCTLTHKSLRVPERVRIEMFFSTLRKLAEFFPVHFKKLLWVLRTEQGEITARPHFHALIAGCPTSAVNSITCFALMKTWESFGGGIARVRVYDATFAGVAYVLKGVNEAQHNAGANIYELGKFGSASDVMLSKSLIEVVHRRSKNRPMVSTGPVVGTNTLATHCKGESF